MTSATKKSDGTRFSLVIGDVLAQWLARPETTPSLANRLNPFLRHELYPREYVALINSALAAQSAIGWLNMFRGYLTKKWYQLASSHFGPDDEPDTIIHRNDGANRVHRVLQIIHTLTTDIWLGRNEVLHRGDKAQETRRLSAIDSEITKFHSEADLVLTDDRFYCETSLNRLLKGSAANKRRWLKRVKESRQRKAILHNNQPRITKFFPPNGLPGTSQEDRPQQSKSKRNTTTQQLMTQFLPERASNHPSSARNTNTQKLITNFLKERASNHTTVSQDTPSPSPSTNEIG